jgi:hypothetical protein
MINKINRALDLLCEQELEAGLGLENGKEATRSDDLGYHLEWLIEDNGTDEMFEVLYNEVVSSLNDENLQKLRA